MFKSQDKRTKISTQIDKTNMLWYSLDYAYHQQMSKTKLDAACPYPRDVKPWRCSSQEYDRRESPPRVTCWSFQYRQILSMSSLDIPERVQCLSIQSTCLCMNMTSSKDVEDIRATPIKACARHERTSKAADHSLHTSNVLRPCRAPKKQWQWHTCKYQRYKSHAFLSSLLIGSLDLLPGFHWSIKSHIHWNSRDLCTLRKYYQ